MSLSQRAKVTKRKKGKTQIKKSKDKKGDITIDITEIQRIRKECFGNFYSNKSENLGEMDFMCLLLDT
jgi:hypothetical protein